MYKYYSKPKQSFRSLDIIKLQSVIIRQLQDFKRIKKLIAIIESRKNKKGTPPEAPSKNHKNKYHEPFTAPFLFLSACLGRVLP
jgi:hypothetical protein